MFREKIAAWISKLHHNFPGKKLRKKTLVEILGSILILDSEQQESGLLPESFSLIFQTF